MPGDFAAYFTKMLVNTQSIHCAFCFICLKISSAIRIPLTNQRLLRKKRVINIKRDGLIRRIKYRFDCMMAKGNLGMIKILLVGTLAVVAVIAIAIHLSAPPEDRDLAGSLWDALASAVNAWMPYSDDGSPAYIVLTALAAVAGLLFTSLLIGIFAGAIEQKMTDLREGNSTVLERGHIVVLGFTTGEYTLLRQLIATARGKKTCIVVTGEMPRSDMETDIRENVEIPKNVKVICRTAAPGDVRAIEVCSIRDCKTVVINQANDEMTVKSTLAACRILSAAGQSDVRIIANVADPSYLIPHDLAVKMNVIGISVNDVIARVIAHSCTETGISRAYEDLFDIEGNNLRIAALPEAAGKTFARTVRTMNGAVPVGVVSDRLTNINPPSGYVISPDDKMIVWVEDAEKISFIDDRYAAGDTQPIPAPEEIVTVRTLVIGTGSSPETLLQELPECRNLITFADVPDDARDRIREFADRRADVELSFFDGDADEIPVITGLLRQTDHIVILADDENDDVTNILRYIRINDIKHREGLDFSVTLELRNEADLQLVGTDNGTDFIVAPHIVSMFLSQIADSPDITSAFKELLSNTGREIHLKPASILGAGRVMTCAEIRAELISKGNIFLGYTCRDKTTLNPDLDEVIKVGEIDKLVVISEK